MKRMVDVAGMVVLAALVCATPSGAGGCPVAGQAEELYLWTGNPHNPQAVQVGCLLIEPASTGLTCADVAPQFRGAEHPGTKCHACLQSAPISYGGGSYQPIELLRSDRGAFGLFAHPAGLTASLTATPFGCLTDPEWTRCSQKGHSTLSCKPSCARADTGGGSVFRLASWSFDRDFRNDHGAVSGGKAPAFVPGVVRGAIRFRSGAEYLEYPESRLENWLDVGTSSFSIDGWIRTTRQGTQVVASKRRSPGTTVGPFVGPDPKIENPATSIYLRETSAECSCPATGYCGFQVVTSGGRIGLQLANGSASGSSWYNHFASPQQGKVADGEWHHFAIVVDRGDKPGIRFYVDGEPAGTDSIRRPGCYSNDETLFVGGQSPSASFSFIGELDAFDIWFGALTGEDVRGIYEASSIGVCPDV